MIHSSDRVVTGVSPRIDGKFLLVDGRRFLVKGVSYGTFAPDADGAQFPPPGQLVEDFASMAAAGFNTVRTYTVPSTAILDAAAQHALRVIVGIPWPQHIAFLSDARLARQIRRDALATVRRLASHPGALLFAVGNEISPAVVRWHSQRRIEQFLHELYQDIKSAAPESLVTYVNFPPTEYLELDCFDVYAFNVYLHRESDLRAYLARLQHIAGPKPLLLAEAGADSLREGLDGQARITAMHVRTAFEEGACGAVAFSWTDQWWRGGHVVNDWTFGMVDAERRPKPALAAVKSAFADAPFSPNERSQWPMVSVVVCAHNAADTLDDCLTSLAALTYPQVEVLVVNDGSRDRTPAIARQHGGVRVIDMPHGGLSAARNVGLAEARGEIVAYTDADVRVDPDWLTYLVQPLLHQDVAGVGGPNIVPQDDPWVAQCVARTPGGPTHVLLDDRIAEHVPGCNMAFRRDALLSIGGFNPVYLRAGDDVDLCWRLQASGLQIGFAGAALVWHHHRPSLTAFWRQQVGYGEAEAWLSAHHPDKFAAGEMLWRGHIYSPLPFVRAFHDRRVNTGTWGTAAFPSVYSTGAHPLRFLPHSSVWMAVCSALLLIAVATLPATAAMWLLATGLLGWVTTLTRCVMFARRSRLDGLAPAGRLSPRQSRVLYRAAIAWLHLIQPLARMSGRIRGMWSMPHVVQPEHVTRLPWKPSLLSLRDMGSSVFLLTGADCERAFWSESWVAHTTLLTELVGVLRALRPAQIVELDDGWHADRDLSVAVGRWGRLHVRVLVEEHAEGRCLLRTGACLRPSYAGVILGVVLTVAVTAAVGTASASGDWSWLRALSTIAAAGIVARVLWQTTRAAAVFDRALTRVTADGGMLTLPISTPTPEPGRSSFRPATAARALLAAVVVMIVVSLGRGGLSLGRHLLATLAASTAAVPDAASSGGVAVGLAGDVFVADAQEGVIRRLRPRPPLDASWTADDIGTGGDPLLGHAVPFDTVADIAVAPDGDVYIADARHNRIRQVVRSTGHIVTIAGSGAAGFDGDGGPAVSASLRSPSAVAVAHNGDVYIADTLNHRIRVIAHATGFISTIAGDGLTAGEHQGDGGPALRAQLDHPAGLAVAPNGDLYVADTGHNLVRRISADNRTITTIAGDGRTGSNGDGGPAIRASLAAPMGLALSSTNGRLVVYVADLLNNKVRVVESDGGISTLDSPGRILSPTRVAYHPAGWLYVKDASPDGVTAVATSKLSPVEAAIAPGRPAGRE